MEKVGGWGEGFVLPGFVSHYMPMISDNFTVRERGGEGAEICMLNLSSTI